MAKTEGAVAPGILSTIDGRPGPAMQSFMEAQEDDLQDICVRTADVIYGRKYGMALVMDVYTPKQRQNGAGVIQIVSGGLWSGVEYRRMPLFTRKIRTLVDRGYAVFAVVHGSQPKYTILEIKDDIPRAVRHVRCHASQFGIEPDRIGVTGISSGGYLALLAATSAKEGDPLATDPVDRERSHVQAVVAYYPNADLLNYGAPNKLMSEHFSEHGLRLEAMFDFHSWDRATGLFVPMSASECREAFRDLSPLVHVTSQAPPTLLFHGDKDVLVPIQQSQVFARRMKELGATCRLIVAEGQQHGWTKLLRDETNQFVGWFDEHL